MMEEGGFIGIKKQDKAYDIENRYGYGVEEMYSSAFYNTRPEQFFEFYKKEMLYNAPRDTASGPALAAMERAGKLKCIISSNIYELSERSGCHNVINLHGSIYQNHCQKCGKKYSIDYIRQARKVPYCEACGGVIRPDVSFFGEMLDSEKLSRTLEEIEKSDVLLLLGTSLSSDVFRNYIKCFEGSKIVLIHNKEKLMDEKADLLIYDEPKNVLPKLGF